MSHYVAEIVIPPRTDVPSAVTQVMEYFCDEPEDGEKGNADWWDFFIIGGRWSGNKLQASLDPGKLEAFHKTLQKRKVTVSGLVCGKEELQPSSQIPSVDRLWREFFPGKGDKCPLFQHSRDQYRKEGFYADDVCRVADVPERLECTRLILAGPHWKEKEKLEAKRMLVAEFWNKVEHQKTDYDGNVAKGIQRFVTEDAESRAPVKLPSLDDWQVVTVDYHN